MSNSAVPSAQDAKHLFTVLEEKYPHDVWEKDTWYLVAVRQNTLISRIGTFGLQH